MEKYLPLLLRGCDCEVDLRPGYLRNAEELKTDSKKRAAVYTPAWLVREMLNYPEAKEALHRKPLLETVCLEAACGEAPFIVQRYDMYTGEPIEIADREGILDQKIKYSVGAVSSYTEWYPQARRAFETTYGTDKHLSSLIIARMNVLSSFIEYCQYYGYSPPEADIEEIADIICWNFWQMDWLHPQDEAIKDWRTGEIIKVKEFMSVRGDITGQKFGRLTVIERIEGKDMWRCKCDCGNETTARGSTLIQGRKRSCGCLKRENIERQRNTWKIHTPTSSKSSSQS